MKAEEIEIEKEKTNLRDQEMGSDVLLVEQ